MSSTVKSFKVTYNPINASNTFTNGDFVSGQVQLEVAKDCQIETLSVKFKGKAEVLWTERHGNTTVVYHSKEKYFSVKQYFVHGKDRKDGDHETLLTHQNGETYSSVVAPGSHVYPFTFQIPHKPMPSSFKGAVGKIIYSLEAKLARSMRLDQKDSTKINFWSKPNTSGEYELMAPQHDSKDKKLKVFSSGSVSMDVNLEKTGFFQGEGLKVVACIENNSSREIKPKYTVYSKHSFFARGKRRVHTKDLLKEVGEPISASSNGKFTRVITIPHDAEPSILCCGIIKVEYRLRVYLDVKYASDPEIKFPIILLAGPRGPAVAAPPAASDFGAFGDAYPPAWGLAPPQPPAVPSSLDPPPSYGAYAAYPPVPNYGNKY